MKQVEEFVKQYFIQNNIPLRGQKPKQIDYIKMAVYGAKVAKCSDSSLRYFRKKYFLEKLSTGPLYKYILELHDLDYCKYCNSLMELEDMYKSNQCRKCKVVSSANWRAAKLQRTPTWADLEKIKEFYLNCPEGYEVDHIIPLQGELISGLHVLENLQYLTASENRQKSNKWQKHEI